jgi:hypothetical protein
MRRGGDGERYLRSSSAPASWCPTSSCAPPSSSASPARRRSTSRTCSASCEGPLRPPRRLRLQPRAGDAGGRAAGRVPKGVARRRYEELLAAQEPIARERRQRLVGRRLRVLVEGVHPRDRAPAPGPPPRHGAGHRRPGADQRRRSPRPAPSPRSRSPRPTPTTWSAHVVGPLGARASSRRPGPERSRGLTAARHRRHACARPRRLPSSDLPRGGIAAIGNFDGLHRGQRAVLDLVVARPRARAARGGGHLRAAPGRRCCAPRRRPAG